MAQHLDHDGHEALVVYWRICKGHRYVILACFAAGVMAGAVASHMMTPIYRAMALVQVEEDPSKLVGIQGVYESDYARERHCITQSKLIRSRTVLRAAAERLRVVRGKHPDGAEDSVAALAGALQVRRISNTDLIEVSFEGPDRARVADVANVIVECYREEVLRRGKESSQFATGWLGEQLPRLRAEVIAAERRLQEFQEKHKILSLDHAHSPVSRRLVRLNTGISAAERTCIELEAQTAQLKAALKAPELVEFLPATAKSPVFHQLDSRVAALQNARFELLRTVMPDHRDVKALDSQIAELRTERRAKVGAALSALETGLESERATEDALRAALAEEEGKVLALNEKLIRLNALERDVDRAKQLYEPLLERLGTLDVASALNAAPIRIWERAEEPKGPVKPRRSLILGIGALVGLIVGLRLAFALESSYSRVRSLDELERLTGTKTVGAVPHMDAKDERNRFLACHFDPKSSAAEAFRAVRTGLLMSTAECRSPVVLVTSAIDEEGKTTIATNLASALAQTNKRVLLVDADMRRSSVHRPFGMAKESGLSTYLTDSHEPADAARGTEVPHLTVLPAGASPENPSELLGSSRMAEFFTWAKENFDFVVLDSPPLAAVTDASVLAPLVDGVLVVVRAGRTPRRAVSHGRELLDASKAKLLGAVLNDVPREPGGYGYGHGYYGYGYRYYSDSDKESPD